MVFSAHCSPASSNAGDCKLCRTSCYLFTPHSCSHTSLCNQGVAVLPTEGTASSAIIRLQAPTRSQRSSPRTHLATVLLHSRYVAGLCRYSSGAAGSKLLMSKDITYDAPGSPGTDVWQQRYSILVHTRCDKHVTCLIEHAAYCYKRDS